MENNNQGSNKIICPQITCGIIIGLYILLEFSYVIELIAANGISIFYNSVKKVLKKDHIVIIILDS